MDACTRAFNLPNTVSETCSDVDVKPKHTHTHPYSGGNQRSARRSEISAHFYNHSNPIHPTGEVTDSESHQSRRKLHGLSSSSQSVAYLPSLVLSSSPIPQLNFLPRSTLNPIFFSFSNHGPLFAPAAFSSFHISPPSLQSSTLQ